mmetsp:Transcript_52261/g.131204  ORF Transcript_52261/g.131204 Transcript_52261/m.131204 type:complete len:757 (+) Transcript_52261:112-2382(+)|eukprot:CAMPEP_0177652090 /NCGR_PEP_ID=MMETSP0447-20121125/12919_1 /TAXON_ID=0 /ORGANISM="Stygamoeba regulata, Strain BSH-02190019" /LENGTH=756 /DNA_ID=CAMNT_0019155261 /DNA_START=11 /DNA_END=2281 /DNA_ORIENTATION=+
MEQVDGLLLQAIRGYGFDLGEEVKALADLNSEFIFGVVIYCLKHIDETVEFPNALPRNMAGRVSLATQVCATLKELGYRETIAYAQLLYADAANNRRLLSWLVSMMPASEEEGTQVRTAADLIQEQFVSMLRKSWQPAFSRPHCTPPLHRFVEVCSLRTDPLSMPYALGPPAGRGVAEEYIRVLMRPVTAQTAMREDAIPSLLEHNCRELSETRDRELEWNTLGLDSGLNPWQYQQRKRADILSSMSNVLRERSAQLGGVGSMDTYSSVGQTPAAGFSKRRRNRMKGTRFMHQVDFAERNAEPVPEETEEERNERREAELAELDRKINNAQNHLRRIIAETAQFDDRARQAESRLTAESERMEAMRRHLLIQKKTLDLLPNGEENVKRLRELADRSAERLMILATQWETVRAPLLERYRKLKLQFSDRKSNAQRLLVEMKKMREQMLGLADEFRQRDGVYKELASAFEAMPSNISREVYTDRIIDIVRQVKKQKVDIDKILRDTRDLQQEVNTISGTLDRSFAVAQELVFQHASTSKDPAAKEAYRLVVGIHQDFGALAVSVHERGQVRNKILQTEERIETMGKRVEALRLEQVQSDLEKMETANRALFEQLKQAGADMAAFTDGHTPAAPSAASKLIRMESSATVSERPAAATDPIGAVPPQSASTVHEQGQEQEGSRPEDELHSTQEEESHGETPVVLVPEALSTAAPNDLSSTPAQVEQQPDSVAEPQTVHEEEEDAGFSDPLGVDPLGVGAQ